MEIRDCLQEKRSSRVLGFLAIPFALVLIAPLMLLFPIIGIVVGAAGLASAAAFVLSPQSLECRLQSETRG